MPPTRAVAKKKKAAARKKAKKVADAALTLAVEVVPMKEPKKKKGGAAKKKKAAAKKKKAAAAVKKPRAPRVRKPSAILREDTPHESAAEHDEYMRRYAGVIDRRSGRFKGVTRGDWERWFERDPVTKRISRRDKTREWPVHKQLAARADKAPKVISTVPLRPEAGGKKKKKKKAAAKKKAEKKKALSAREAHIRSVEADGTKFVNEETGKPETFRERLARLGKNKRFEAPDGTVWMQVKEKSPKKKKAVAKKKEPTLADVKKVWMEVPGRVGDNPPAPKKKAAAKNKAAAKKEPFFDKPAKKPRAGNKKKAAAAAMKEVPRAALPDGMEWIESRLNDANVPTPSVAVTTTPLPPPPDNYPPPPAPPSRVRVPVANTLENIARIRMALSTSYANRFYVALQLLRRLRPETRDQGVLEDAVTEMVNELRTSLDAKDLEHMHAEILPSMTKEETEEAIRSETSDEFRTALIDMYRDAISLKRVQQVVNMLEDRLPRKTSTPLRNQNGVIVGHQTPITPAQEAEMELAEELNEYGADMEKG